MSRADLSAGSKAESVVGGLAPPGTESFFVFGYPKRAFITSRQNFVNFVNHKYFK